MMEKLYFFFSVAGIKHSLGQHVLSTNSETHIFQGSVNDHLTQVTLPYIQRNFNFENLQQDRSSFLFADIGIAINKSLVESYFYYTVSDENMNALKSLGIVDDNNTVLLLELNQRRNEENYNRDVGDFDGDGDADSIEESDNNPNPNSLAANS